MQQTNKRWWRNSKNDLIMNGDSTDIYRYMMTLNGNVWKLLLSKKKNNRKNATMFTCWSIPTSWDVLVIWIVECTLQRLPLSVVVWWWWLYSHMVIWYFQKHITGWLLMHSFSKVTYLIDYWCWSIFVVQMWFDAFYFCSHCKLDWFDWLLILQTLSRSVICSGSNQHGHTCHF